MTDRINLTQLRQRAETGDTHPELTATGWIDIAITDLLALIDAAEAARQYKRTGSRTDEMYLYDALDRFDHT